MEVHYHRGELQHDRARPRPYDAALNSWILSVGCEGVLMSCATLHIATLRDTTRETFAARPDMETLTGRAEPEMYAAGWSALD
jgi:hypothetical protein